MEFSRNSKKLLIVLLLACFAFELSESSPGSAITGTGVPLGRDLARFPRMYSVWCQLIRFYFFSIQGLLIDKSWPPEVKKLAETTIEYLNSQIKYGRNKWAFQISTLKSTDSNQQMRAGKFG